MEKLSIAVIKQKFQEEKITDEDLLVLRQDSRKGVQVLVTKHDKKLALQKELLQNFRTMQSYENKARQLGYNLIAGVDEAGRGPLAGPVVTAAVILPHDFVLLGLNDSKKLTEDEKNRYFDEIKKAAISYEISVISNDVIDSLNILQATKLGMREAIENLSVQPDHVLIDAEEIDGLTCSSEAIIKGDERSVSIAAASVLAKVTRDRLMIEIDKEFPMYGFATNMGYGTKVHIEGLEKYGITKYHRKSFAPIRNYVL